MKEGELAVLFRNNHYLTVTKQNERLFTLVTDQGYIQTSNCVWEELNYSGGGEFVNQDFLTKEQAEAMDATFAQDLAQADLRLAQQLQREEEQRANRNEQSRTNRRQRKGIIHNIYATSFTALFSKKVYSFITVEIVTTIYNNEIDLMFFFVFIETEKKKSERSSNGKTRKRTTDNPRQKKQ